MRYILLLITLISFSVKAQTTNIEGLAFFKKNIKDDNGKLLSSSDSVTLISYLNGYWKCSMNGGIGYIVDGVFNKKPVRKFYFVRKYGIDNGTSIYYGKIEIGMTDEMVKEVKGAPDDINRTITQYSAREQWVYGYIPNMKLYYFEDGVLTAIQE